MSAPMTAPMGAPLDFSQTPKVPFTRLVEVEFRKTYDTRASFWLLVAIAALALIVDSIVLIAVLVGGGGVTLGEFIVVPAIVSAVTLPILGIMLVTSEWTQRTAMVTFALEPNRARVLLAKLAVGVLLTLLTALLILVISFVFTVLCEIAQPDETTFETENILYAFVVILVLAMIGGFAIATLLLNTPAAIVLLFVYRFVVPGITAIGGSLLDFIDDIRPWIDFQTAQGPIYDWALDSGEEWAHLLVSGTLWLALPLCFGFWRVLRAEVK